MKRAILPKFLRILVPTSLIAGVTGVAASAQTNTNTAGTGAGVTATRSDRDDDTDYGWIGFLLGLAGLAGLLRLRHSPDHDRGGGDRTTNR
jgi:hypothetical protein